MLQFNRSILQVLLTLNAALFAQELSIDAGIGYRQDSLEWSLAGGSDGPSTLSKLSWKDVQSVDFMADLELKFCNRYYLRIDGNYGHIYHGKNSDKDWGVIQETSEDILVLESHAKANKGSVWDVSIAASYYSYCISGACELRPLIGYSIHRQDLHMTDGVMVVDVFDPQDVGQKFEGLDSSYKTYWSGPWIGFDFIYDTCGCWSFSTTQELHALYYQGKGNWNLREDLLGNFRHTGWGWGYFMTVAADYEIDCGWRVGARIKYNYCRMNHGHDKSRIIIDETDDTIFVATAVTGIKHSIWNSFAALVTLGYSY